MSQERNDTVELGTLVFSPTDASNGENENHRHSTGGSESVSFSFEIYLVFAPTDDPIP